MRVIALIEDPAVIRRIAAGDATKFVTGFNSINETATPRAVGAVGATAADIMD